MNIALPAGFTLATLIALAREAGAIQLRHFQSHGMNREFKQDSTPVTLADTETSEHVMNTMTSRFPMIRVHGEEGRCRVANTPWLLLVDELDGTFPFTWGMPVSTTTFALLYEGMPVLAAIYDPHQDRMYAAELGKGATLNGIPLAVSQVSDTAKKPVIGIVSWPRTGINDPLSNVLAAGLLLEQAGFQILNFCSIGYMMAAVATGEWLATIFPAKSPLETAAGHLLITEAGGRCTSLYGKEQRYDGDIHGHVISNGPFHDQIVAAIRAADGA